MRDSPNDSTKVKGAVKGMIGAGVCVFLTVFIPWVLTTESADAFWPSKRESDIVGSVRDLPISQASYNLILHHEVSSRAFYDEIYSKPTVPPEDSGVTIGIGYDLGQVSMDTFLQDWGPYLPRDQTELLATCIGLRRGSARAALRRVGHVVIPFEVAEQVFLKRSLPGAMNETVNTFPGSENLHPDIFGALVSLVYNRGGGLKDSPGSNRRAEMRALRELILAGNVGAIPAKFREMKRIWAGGKSRGLLRRREDEARLVETALGRGAPYMLAFDSQSRGSNSYAPPPMREIVPATTAEAEEIRGYFFYNAEAVANSLRDRITAAGDKNICTLKVASDEDMLWLTEFKGLVVQSKTGERVQKDKNGNKFVEVDITDLDFSEYPPTEVSRILLLTQSLLNTKIPSPLLANWSPNQNGQARSIE